MAFDNLRVLVACVLALYIMVMHGGLRQSHDLANLVATQQSSEAPLTNFGTEVKHKEKERFKPVAKAAPRKKTPQAPYAYVTLLSTSDEEVDLDDPNIDPHIIAARMLAYQLLHAPKTRTRKDYPFVVAVTPEVPSNVRDRLKKDGATIVEVEHLTPGWIADKVEERYSDVMTKMRIASWTQYDLVLILDLDTVLTDNIDGVFDIEEARVLDNLHLEYEGENDAVKEDEGPQPEKYVFAGVSGLAGNHAFPPKEEERMRNGPGYWANAGFFIIKPTQELYDHYLTVMEIPHRFDGGWPEEGLLNYVHRPGGNMPWLHLDNIWNTPFAWKGDLDAGVRSLHRKWWAESGGLEDYMHQIRWQMDGWFRAMDQMKG